MSNSFWGINRKDGIDYRMQAKLFRVIVPVSDLPRSVGFYSVLLGGSGKRVSVGRHYFTCGSVILACYDPLTEDGKAFTANPQHIYFSVEDLEGAYELAKTAGCEWLEEAIHVRAWGERSFYARDPFGNRLCFVDFRTVYTG